MAKKKAVSQSVGGRFATVGRKSTLKFRSAKDKFAVVREKVGPGVTIGKVLPSFITLCSTVLGMSAILWAGRGYFGRAVLLVIFAALCDMLDGAAARRLKTTSKFGVELDSLSDVISFGVAPAFIMYYFSAYRIKAFGWIAALVFVIAGVLRLARFNVMAGEERKTPEHWKNFFIGMPIPAGALMAMYPIALFYTNGNMVFVSPQLGIAFLMFFAMMMVSRVPTFALKKARLPSELVPYVLIVLIFTLALMFHHFWYVLSILGVVYMLSIPWTIISFLKIKRLARGGR